MLRFSLLASVLIVLALAGCGLSSTTPAPTPTPTTPTTPTPEPDTTPPTVVSISPANGATAIESDANIIITFSEGMDQAATEAAYQSADLPTSEVSFS